MERVVYSKRLNITSEDVRRCTNIAQLQRWRIEQEGDIDSLRTTLNGLLEISDKNDPEDKPRLQKVSKALGNQQKLLAEINRRISEMLEESPDAELAIIFYNIAEKYLSAKIFEQLHQKAVNTLLHTGKRRAL